MHKCQQSTQFCKYTAKIQRIMKKIHFSTSIFCAATEELLSFFTKCCMLYFSTHLGSVFFFFFCKHCHPVTVIRAGYGRIQGPSSSDTSIVGMPIRGNWIILLCLSLNSPHLQFGRGGHGWRRNMGSHRGVCRSVLSAGISSLPVSLLGTGKEHVIPEPRGGKTRAYLSSIIHHTAGTMPCF